MILKKLELIARRRFVAILGGTALFGIAAKSLLNSTASAQTTGGDVIDILIQDHRAIEALLNQIAQTPESNPSRRIQLLQQLITLLTVHNASEENYVYPAIRDIARLPNDATLLYQQQDQSKIIVFELDQLTKVASPDWDARLAALRSALLAHVSQEENVDFPRLRQAAAGSILTNLTAAVRRFRAQFGF